MDTDDPRIPDSLKIAHERGIRIVWSIQKESNAPHPNTTTITVKMIIKRFLLLESQLVVGTYRLLS